MSCGWLGERVATVNCKNAISNVIKNQPQLGFAMLKIFLSARSQHLHLI